MRVTLDVGECMMLSMNGDPLSGFDSRGDPDHRSEDVGNRSSKSQSTVRQGAMQIDRCCKIGQKRCNNTSQDPDDDRSHGLTVTRKSKVTGTPFHRCVAKLELQ